MLRVRVRRVQLLAGARHEARPEPEQARAEQRVCRQLGIAWEQRTVSGDAEVRCRHGREADRLVRLEEARRARVQQPDKIACDDCRQLGWVEEKLDAPPPRE